RWIRGKDLCRHTFAGGPFATQSHKQKSQRRLANGDRSGCVSTRFLRAHPERLRQRFPGFVSRRLFAVCEGEGQREAVGTCLRSRHRPFRAIEPEETSQRLVKLHMTGNAGTRSEEHTSELQSRGHLVCRLLLE